MTYQSFILCVILSVSRYCDAVVVIIDGEEVDCFKRCGCCKGGCYPNPAFGIDYCFRGCVETIWGYNCRNSCPENCLTCYQGNGHCKKCRDTYYDLDSNCNKTCSRGCNEGRCDVDGNCTCTDMFEGSKCDICKTGFYDINTLCQTPCSHGCQNGDCDVDGTCTCRHGFTGSACTKCVTGYYGSLCSFPCSKRCVDDVCNDDGSCNCREQFTGFLCMECFPGYYGEYCNNTCSSGCRIQTACESSSGLCIGGCVEGYWGNQCETSCNSLCKKCDRITSECIDCIVVNTYGKYCNSSCSHGCINSECSMQGQCILGCNEGYTGVRCEIASGSWVIGLTAGMGVIGLVVGGIVSALIANVIHKRRQRMKETNQAVSDRQRSLDGIPSNTNGNFLYEELDMKQSTPSQDNQQYDMLPASANSAHNETREEDDKDNNSAVDNEYNNERLGVRASSPTGR